MHANLEIEKDENMKEPNIYEVTDALTKRLNVSKLFETHLDMTKKGKS